jgi:CheY-like chemotaxis protein
MYLPVYAHPTTTVLVDDSDSFLRSLSFQLDPMLANKTFHDTTEALHWLRNSAPESAVPLHVNFDMQNLPADQCNVALDLERIYRIAEQRQRFATPSVLVVDYSMPQMNGLEFCAAVAHLPCKKILFTGAADEKIAVSAFNRGLIDRYIKKSDDHALDILEMEVAALQESYFDSHSDRCARWWRCTIITSCATRRWPRWCGSSSARWVSSSTTSFLTRPASCSSTSTAKPR